MGLNFVVSTVGPKQISLRIVSKIPVNTTFSWDFGDNTEISTDRSPRHTYSESGFYTVRLTATIPNTSEGVALFGADLPVNKQFTDNQEVQIQGIAEPTISVVTERTVLISDNPCIKTHLNDSIYNLIDSLIPEELSANMSFEDKSLYISKWQLYIGPLVNHFIPPEYYQDELYYEALENQLIMELAAWDFLNTKLSSLLSQLGTFLEKGASWEHTISSGGDSNDSESGSRIKKITTGPTEVEYFDQITESFSGLFRSFANAFNPGGVMDMLRNNLCTLANRVEVFLPFCKNYVPPVVPKVVNRRIPYGLKGPDPKLPLNKIY